MVYASRGGGERTNSNDESSGSPAYHSSADFYAAVPTAHEDLQTRYTQNYHGTESSAPNRRSYGSGMTTPTFGENDNNQFPIRRASDATMGYYKDPYARYDEHSTYSLGGDGSSQLGLAPRPGSNLASYDKYEEHEMDDNNAQAISSAPRSRKLARTSGEGFWAKLSSRARKVVVIAFIFIIAFIILAVAIPIVVTSRHTSKGNGSATNVSAAQDPASTPPPRGVPTGASGSQDWRTAAAGGDGSIVYTEGGSSFVYNNSFGGFWVSVPFNDSAQAQKGVPPLSQAWNYDTDLINGVNLGGWLVIEPFITPSLFEPFDSPSDNPNATNLAIDEWTLSVALGSNMTSVITNHYNTFITEQDFAEIAGAGLNWVRLPLPYWAIETWDGEPFLANVAWTYFLKAITWARKYGLRINLDFHAVAGSQNGYNHSSKQGSINVMNGAMGIANAQRYLSYVNTLTQFISQPMYKNVVPMFSVLNEPSGSAIGNQTLRYLYFEIYNMMRNITGIGAGQGPTITFHDAFLPLNTSANDGWLGWMPGMDRVGLDRHPYLCFSAPNDDGLSYQAAKPCSYWAQDMNETTNQFGLSIAGEWSLAINDCGKWLNNVGNGNRYDGTYYTPDNVTAPHFKGVGSCTPWNVSCEQRICRTLGYELSPYLYITQDYTTWNQSTKDGLRLVAIGHMDALRHWFFWTWKTGYSSTLGMIANPMWNYQLGINNGWIPKDPRVALGACKSLVSENGFTVTMGSDPAPTLAPWMTGGSGAGSLQNSVQAALYGEWPPATMQNPTPTIVSNLLTYTPTANAITLPVATPTSYPAGFSATATPGDGWYNNNDTLGQYTPVGGCSYPNPWSGVQVTIPSAPCTGNAARAKRTQAPKLARRATPPGITAPPKLHRRRIE